MNEKKVWQNSQIFFKKLKIRLCYNHVFVYESLRIFFLKIFGPFSNSKVDFMCENEVCVQIALAPICTQSHSIVYK